MYYDNKGSYPQQPYPQQPYPQQPSSVAYPTPPSTQYAYPPQPSYQYPPPSNQQYENYPPPPPPLNNSGTPFQGDSIVKVNPTPKYQDVWATILWIIDIAALVLVAFIYIPIFKSNSSQNEVGSGTGEQFNINIGEAIGFIILSMLVGLILSAIYLQLMQRFASAMITVTLVLTVVINLLIAIYFFIIVPSFAGIIFLIFALFYAFCAWTWRHRIPFAAIMLSTVTSVTRHFHGMVVLTAIMGIVQAALHTWIIIMIFGVQLSVGNQNLSGKEYAVYVFLIFSFYWNSQIFKNIVHVTVSGVFASYYFMAQQLSDLTSPTTVSAKRAVTTSLGSICYGSLIIAIIRTIRALIRMAADQNQGGIMALVAMCVLCLLGCIENLLEYFNQYAFAEVAIYGKDFCSAAKDTWELIKRKGIDAIINDNLVGNVLTAGVFIIGIICAVVGYIYVKVFPFFAIPGATPNDNTTIIIVLVVISFFIGVIMSLIFLEVIESGVTATFVCLAEDPQALRRTKPELYERIRQTYPQVEF